MGRGQRSHGSRSKVTWVNPSLKVIILAGGLTSTSSCIFNFWTDSKHYVQPNLPLLVVGGSLALQAADYYHRTVMGSTDEPSPDVFK